MKKTLSFILVSTIIGSILSGCAQPKPNPIRVGILHSQTGTMANSESPVIDATLLAIEEINANRGLLGRDIEAVIMDSRSDPEYAAEAAEQLITIEQAKVIFGCWTSACRKTVKPIVEKHNTLMFYPVQFEGLENSANIVYTGTTPNQQILPAIQWAYQNLGTRFFLVGSDYVFPRAANEIIKDYVPLLGGEIVGEGYLLLGDTNATTLVDKIIKAKPDVILNTINGESNIAFFDSLRAAGITSDVIPTISFSIAEAELQNMDLNIAGNYAAWNYFQSIPTSQNKDFISRFQNKYGRNSVVDDPMEAAYTGVYLWAKAVESAGTFDSNDVVQYLYGQRHLAPQGFVRIDKNILYLWKNVRIGKIREDGQFDIVWESNVDIRPEPFPKSRTQLEWENYLDSLYKKWNENWVNPGKTLQ